MEILKCCYFNFSFVKVALTKNPKKRPTAERMLYQPFVLSGDLNHRLSVELLNKVRNPESIYGSGGMTTGAGIGGQAGVSQSRGAGQYGVDPDGDDEGVNMRPPPARIEQRGNRTSQKTKSELNSKYRLLLIFNHCVHYLVISVQMQKLLLL